MAGESVVEGIRASDAVVWCVQGMQECTGKEGQLVLYPLAPGMASAIG